MLGFGYSHDHPPDNAHLEPQEHLYESGKLLPFDLRVIRESLFVYHTYVDNTGITDGALILSINGASAAEVIDRLRRCLPSDGQGEAKKNFLLSRAFNDYHLRFIGDAPVFDIEYRDPDDTGPGTRSVRAQTWRDIRVLQAHDTRWQEKEATETFIPADGKSAVLTIPLFDHSDA